VLVFSIAAFFAGIAGGLLGPITGTAAAASGIDVGGFDFSVSLLLITVLFVAGRQPIFSAVLASVLLVIIPSYATGATAVKWNPIIFGSLAIVAALFGGRSLVEWLGSSRRLRERADSPTPAAERAALGPPAGELVLEGGAGAGVYWRYERWIRGQESRFRGIPGMTGAIAMMRRADFMPLPAEVVLDDVWMPMKLALAGKRLDADLKELRELLA